MKDLEPLFCNLYGSTGPYVIVLHGGPAAAGSAELLAKGLADSFRVIEPYQRGSSDTPLSVARHIADIHEIVEKIPGGGKPALVGESWGAMLALSYAAAHPQAIDALALVGCGTFDKTSRAKIIEILETRMDSRIRSELKSLETHVNDSSERMRKRYALLTGLYDYAPIKTLADENNNLDTFDVRAHKETWDDMLRLQAKGIYPAAFSAIRSPIVMLHGSYDPHPGPMIRDSLLPHIPHLEYREWEKCGHRPWIEKYVQDEFFRALKDWLILHCSNNM